MVKNIEEISNNYLCTNCGACIATCPRNAISMKYTNIGRLHSVVNSNCIDCGLCLKVCPSYNYQSLKNQFSNPYTGVILDTYITRSSQKDIFENAQSGGMCTTTLHFLFEKKLIDAAIVCIQEISEHPRPKAIVVEEKKEVNKSQKSNYTPVDILSALKNTINKKSVAIVGLPCHIRGVSLLAENNKKYSNITYKLGLICDRTLCDGITDVLNSYVQAQNYKVSWRLKYLTGQKKWNYRSAPIAIHAINKKVNIIPNYYRFELKDMFTAPHCRICYDKINVFSDIVFGDPWLLDDVDWIKGDSLVITRTEKGQSLFTKLADEGYAINIRKPSIKRVLDGQFIFEKEEQHDLYINAFRKVFSSSISEKLFNDIDIRENEFVKCAEKEFEEFKSNEKLSKKHIILLARKVIFKKQIFLLQGKIKSTIRKIFKFNL